MVKLADTLDLGSNGAIRAGSSPVARTMKKALFVYQTKALFSTKSVLTGGWNPPSVGEIALRWNPASRGDGRISFHPRTKSEDFTKGACLWFHRGAKRDFTVVFSFYTVVFQANFCSAFSVIHLINLVDPNHRSDRFRAEIERNSSWFLPFFHFSGKKSCKNNSIRFCWLFTNEKRPFLPSGIELTVQWQSVQKHIQ